MCKNLILLIVILYPIVATSSEPLFFDNPIDSLEHVANTKDRSNLSTLFELVELQYLADNLDEVNKNLDRIAKANKLTPNTDEYYRFWHWKAEYYIVTKEYRKAISIIKELCSSEQKYVELNNLLIQARAFYMSGKRDSSEIYFEKGKYLAEASRNEEWLAKYNLALTRYYRKTRQPNRCIDRKSVV